MALGHSVGLAGLWRGHTTPLANVIVRIRRRLPQGQGVQVLCTRASQLATAGLFNSLDDMEEDGG